MMEKRLEDLERRRQERLNIVNVEYYDIHSPHFKDNERFAWAVDTINKNFDKEKFDIIDEEVSKPVVHYMTVSQILEKYEYCLDKDQIQILKNLE